MNLPLNLLVAAATVAGAGAASAQTVYIQEQPGTETIVSDPVAVTPIQRTTVYRNIIPQGGGRAPIVRERIVTERFAPVAPLAREQVVVVPRDANYGYGTREAAYYGYDTREYGYGTRDAGYYEVPARTYEVAPRTYAVAPRVTERVVTAPLAITVPAYGARDAYARGAGTREVVYEVDTAPVLSCKQRYRSYDPVSGTYLGYDGLRHPCR
jgi:BA14K-like protein